ncbi:hypothetical protein ACWD4J_38090 [Streptomyces sp. NPDC002577]
MRVVWIVFAVLLVCLTIGALISVAKDTDVQSVISDLAAGVFLGWGAVACWQRARA